MDVGSGDDEKGDFRVVELCLKHRDGPTDLGSRIVIDAGVMCGVQATIRVPSARLSAPFGETRRGSLSRHRYLEAGDNEGRSRLCAYPASTAATRGRTPAQGRNRTCQRFAHYGSFDPVEGSCAKQWQDCGESQQTRHKRNAALSAESACEATAIDRAGTDNPPAATSAKPGGAALPTQDATWHRWQSWTLPQQALPGLRLSARGRASAQHPGARLSFTRFRGLRALSLPSARSACGSHRRRSSRRGFRCVLRRATRCRRPPTCRAPTRSSCFGGFVGERLCPECRPRLSRSADRLMETLAALPRARRAHRNFGGNVPWRPHAGSAR